MRDQRVLRRKKQKGSAMLESALVLSVFLLTIIAVLDFAQFLFIHQSLVEATRKAARYGVVTAYNETEIRNVLLYDDSTGGNGAPARFDLTASMVSVRRVDPGTPADRVEVKLSNYPFKVYTPMIAGTLTGLPITATVPYEIP